MDPTSDFSLNELFVLITADTDDRVYYLLSTSIIIFFLLSAFFAMLSIFLRYRNNRLEHLWESLQVMWDNDILLVLSGDMSEDEFLKKIPPRHELNFIKYLTPYAWRLTGTDLDTLARLAKPYLPHLIRKLRHHNPEIRAWAVNALSLFGMPRHTASVLQLLRDPSSVVAMSAANALLRQREVKYIGPVLKYFHRFDHWNLASVTHLITECGTGAIPVLERVYLDAAIPVRTRIVAAESLRELNDYDIADRAAAILETETNQELISATLRLLGAVGQTTHRDIVIRLCKSDNEVIRVNAMRTLRNIGIAEDLPVFRHGVVDASPWVAVQSAWGLHELGDDAFLNALVSKGHSRARLAQQILSEAGS